MKVKTADLIGPALDWAVATARGCQDLKVFGRSRPTDRGWVEVRFNPDPRARTVRYDPSESWEYGGPIIEWELISLEPKFRCADVNHPNGYWEWQATCINEDDKAYWYDGTTPLIAAMRCYVASKLGYEIDVPNELIKHGGA